MSRPEPARQGRHDGCDELEDANASFFIDKLGGECGDRGWAPAIRLRHEPRHRVAHRFRATLAGGCPGA